MFSNFTFLILLVIFCIIFANITARILKTDIGDVSFLWSLVGITVFFINFAVVNHTKVVDSKKYTIYSTASDSKLKTSGEFFLGTGTIDSKEVYLGNIQTKPNVFNRIYIPVAQTDRIIDSNLTNKAIYVHKICRTYHLMSYSIKFPCISDDESSNIHDVLYIPKNSIIHQLNFQ